jgi:hypothetical protein
LRRFLLTVGVALALSGCERIQGLIGMDTSDGNRTATNRTRSAAADDALISNLQPIAPSGQDSAPAEAPPADGSDQPAPPPSQDGAAGGFDPAMLVGRWGDNGDCSQPIELFANGTFRGANGSTGNWRVSGNRLTMSGSSRSLTMQLLEVTPRRVRVRDSNGNVGVSTRC